VLINTHLDNVSDAQRQLGAAMILHRARYEAWARPGVPVLVTGDLNRCVFLSTVVVMLIALIVHSSARGSDNAAYAVLSGTAPAPAVPDEFARRFPLPSRPNPAGSPSAGVEELFMRDLRGAAPRASVGGKWATFTGFEHRKDEEACIDFVFGRSDGGWCVPPSFCKGGRLSLTLTDSAVGRQRACLLRRRCLMMGYLQATIV
jgi:hypothetical protein